MSNMYIVHCSVTSVEVFLFCFSFFIFGLNLEYVIMAGHGAVSKAYNTLQNPNSRKTHKTYEYSMSCHVAYQPWSLLTSMKHAAVAVHATALADDHAAVAGDVRLLIFKSFGCPLFGMNAHGVSHMQKISSLC